MHKRKYYIEIQYFVKLKTLIKIYFKSKKLLSWSLLCIETNINNNLRTDLNNEEAFQTKPHPVEESYAADRAWPIPCSCFINPSSGGNIRYALVFIAAAQSAHLGHRAHDCANPEDGGGGAGCWWKLQGDRGRIGHPKELTPGCHDHSPEGLEPGQERQIVDQLGNKQEVRTVRNVDIWWKIQGTLKSNHWPSASIRSIVLLCRTKELPLGPRQLGMTAGKTHPDILPAVFSQLPAS